MCAASFFLSFFCFITLGLHPLAVEKKPLLIFCRTHVTNALVTVVGVAVVVVGAYFSRDYVRRVLLWVAGQEAWVVVLVFLALFTLVSMVRGG